MANKVLILPLTLRFVRQKKTKSWPFCFSGKSYLRLIGDQEALIKDDNCDSQNFTFLFALSLHKYPPLPLSPPHNWQHTHILTSASLLSQARPSIQINGSSHCPHPHCLSHTNCRQNPRCLHPRRVAERPRHLLRRQRRLRNHGYFITFTPKALSFTTQTAHYDMPIS